MTTITPVTVLGGSPESTETPQKEISSVQTQENLDSSMGWEYDLAVKSPNLYATMKTALDIIPFGWAVTPSGQRQFERASVGGKALTLSLDVLGLVPAGILGKGIKLTTAPVRSGIKSLSKTIGNKLPWTMKAIEDVPTGFFDDLTRDLDVFEAKTVDRGLLTKYGLSDQKEIAHVTNKFKKLETVNPSEIVTEGTEEFTKLFNKKGNLRSDVVKDLETWSKSPEAQRLEYATSKWKTLAGSQVHGTGYSLEQVFKNQTTRLFGETKAVSMSLENLGNQDIDLLIKDTFLNEGKIIRGIDSRSYHYMSPVRKVMGTFDSRYKTLDNVYNPVLALTKNTNLASVAYTEKFHAIMASKGIGEKLADGTFKNFFTPTEWKDAGKTIMKLDVAQSSGASQDMINSIVKGTSENTQRIVKSWQEFTDHLYDDFTKTKLLQLTERAGLNEFGKLQVSKLLTARSGEKNIFSKLTELFSATNNLAYETKYSGLKKVLGDFKQTILDNPSWFNEFDAATGTLTKTGKKKVGSLLSQLEFRKAGSTKGLPDYLNNYGTRIFKELDVSKKTLTKTPKSMTSGFVKGRSGETEYEELVTDLSEIASRRIRAQARELYTYPEYNKIMTYAEKNLPENLKAYTGHYLDRVMGRASEVDKKVADVINENFGTHWDAGRVMQLSYSINDLIYMGGIGFKPFSAMRNYVQPLLVVPADMGGVKDILWLAKGTARAFKKETRDYLKEIGAIGDYAPDLLFKNELVNFGKSFKFAGKEISLPSSQKVRDMGLWLFKQSENHNRYITGGAALEKWDYYVKKFATVDPQGKAFMSTAGLEGFKNKLNLASRETWVRADIEQFLRTGSSAGLEEARKIWVKDVIADTQFLYGATDSPLATQVGGIFTRTGLVFQTWWMNYGSLLNKWMTRSGEVDAATERMFTWMLCSAVGSYAMTPLWGKSLAVQSVYTGPLPLEPDIPPSWRPMIEGVKLIAAAGSMPFGMTSIDQMKTRIKSTINTSMIFVPGGLQLKQLASGVSEEGFPKGIAKGILRYNP
jgi:hypothetical protein